MTQDAEKRRSRWSVRSLMLAVAGTALLLAPVTLVTRQNALLRSERMRAVAGRYPFRFSAFQPDRRRGERLASCIGPGGE